MANIPAFQAGARGSSPLTCFENKKIAISNFFLFLSVIGTRARGSTLIFFASLRANRKSRYFFNEIVPSSKARDMIELK